MFVRAYLRASTKEQDASRAKEDLLAFCKERNLRIAATYIENESGASLKRPELFRLLADSQPGDILLIEQVDRLSRLNAEDWDKLKAELTTRMVRVVALDLPTSWTMTRTEDETTARMLVAMNGMMLDMLAAIARKDYTDRRRRQQQGIEKAKVRVDPNGIPVKVYKGRQENTERNAALMKMLSNGDSWNHIVTATGCSRSTLAKLSARMKTAPL